MGHSLTIQVLGFSSSEHLRKAAQGLQTVPEDVVLRYLDNNSQDDSIAVIRQNVPRAEIVELGNNRGYAGAHNIGFAMCETEFVMVHDPDVVVDWPGIKRLLGLFRDQKVAAVQGKVMRPGDDKVIDSCGIELTLALNGKERGSNEIDSGQYEVPTEIVAVTGAVGIYRMSVLKQIGFFDPDFFAYKEDVDLGWRMNRAGWKVLYEPVFMGTHARTMGKRGGVPWFLRPSTIYTRMRSDRTRYSFRNWLWMIFKNASTWQMLVHELFVDARLLAWFFLSLTYPPFFTVWWETWKGVPKMIAKRQDSPKLEA